MVNIKDFKFKGKRKIQTIEKEYNNIRVIFRYIPSRLNPQSADDLFIARIIKQGFFDLVSENYDCLSSLIDTINRAVDFEKMEVRYEI